MKSKSYEKIERKLNQALKYYEVNEEFSIDELRGWARESEHPLNFLKRVIGKVRFESKVELESLVRLLTDFWKYIPRFELGGLSPAEKIEGRTIPSYYSGEGFPYSTEEVKKVEFFHDFLVFLKYIEEKEAKLTQRKNLCLKELKEIVNLFTVPIKMEGKVRGRIFKVHSEEEMPYVEKIHILAELLRLVRKRKGKLVICKRAKGSFNRLPLNIQFQLLWSTYWHHFNWSYFHSYGRESIAEILQKNRYYVKNLILSLDNREEEWINFSRFSKELEKKLNLTWYDNNGVNCPELIYSKIEFVLIEEFKLFGLVETKKRKDEERYYLERLVSFKLTPMGKKVMNIT